MLKKILLVLCAFILIIPFAGYLYFQLAFPKVGPPEDLHVTATPEKLERGKYLAHNVAVCLDCHSTRDWTRYSGPVMPDSWGKGGEIFDESMGLPGTIYARNITPAGIGKWTDGELLRAFTTGVNRDGEALFPLMPYTHFGKMTREDAESILVYVRSLPPIQNEVPKRTLKFPMNLIVRTIPSPAEFAPKVDKNNTVEYGHYLVNMASCAECHTQSKEGQALPGMEFAGGVQFPKAHWIVRSANITPDKDTGIGLWEKADFIKHFRDANTNQVDEKAKNTVMPLSNYAGMTDEDLGSIFDYLRTLKPVRNKVEHFTSRD